MEKKKPKKKKNALPSGSYRVQALDYVDAAGKRHYRSFTAGTKKEAQLLAEEWKLNRKKGIREPDNLTVLEAVERYLTVREAVLSPSTMRGYDYLKRCYFGGSFGRVPLRELDSTAAQIWVSELVKKGLSPKTVRNAYGLLAAALDMFAPDLHLKVQMPARKKPELYCPSDADVKTLLRHIQGTELEIAVLLAAFGPLRRGEICALTDKDVVGNTVVVSKSMVKDSERTWHIKEPKTYGSYREVVLPDFVIAKLSGRRGQIVRMDPDYVTHRFGRVLKTLDIPHFRFHDLRHYAASIMHAIGVPDQYILQRGGWVSDNIMKSVYRNTIDLETVRQTKKINQHFEKLKNV